MTFFEAFRKHINRGRQTNVNTGSRSTTRAQANQANTQAQIHICKPCVWPPKTVKSCKNNVAKTQNSEISVYPATARSKLHKTPHRTHNWTKHRVKITARKKQQKESHCLVSRNCKNKKKRTDKTINGKNKCFVRENTGKLNFKCPNRHPYHKTSQ